MVYSNSEGVCVNLRPAENKLSRMVDLVGHLTNPGQVVVDLFADTCDFSKTFLLLPQTRRFVCFDKDDACLEGYNEKISEMQLLQLCNPESDLMRSDATLSTTEVVVSVREALFQKLLDDYRVVPNGLEPVQTFPPHIIHFVCKYHGYSSLYEYYRHMPLSMSLIIWRSNYYSSYEDSLLSLEDGATGFIVNPFTIQNSGLDVLAERKFGKGEIYFWYYSALIYSFLLQKYQTRKTYGNGFMGVNVFDIEKCDI